MALLNRRPKTLLEFDVSPDGGMIILRDFGEGFDRFQTCLCLTSIGYTDIRGFDCLNDALDNFAERCKRGY